MQNDCRNRSRAVKATPLQWAVTSSPADAVHSPKISGEMAVWRSPAKCYDSGATSVPFEEP